MTINDFSAFNVVIIFFTFVIIISHHYHFLHHHNNDPIISYAEPFVYSVPTSNQFPLQSDAETGGPETVRERCLQDLRERLALRANLLQDRLDQVAFLGFVSRSLLFSWSSVGCS